MAKDPAFLFYASDFLTGTMFFSNEQVGKYIRLLCSQHQHGGLIDKQSFDNLVGEDNLLRSKFISTADGYYNERLSVEMENRNEKSNNISNAAKETWRKRKEEKGKNTTVIQSYKKSKRKVIRTEDVNEDEIVNYFVSKGYSIESAKKFFEYYSVSNWKDSNGNEVRNWKQKANAVWFKDENKIQVEQTKKMVY